MIFRDRCASPILVSAIDENFVKDIAKQMMDTLVVNAQEFGSLTFADAAAVAGLIVGESSCGLFEGAQFSGTVVPTNLPRADYDIPRNEVIAKIEGELAPGATITEAEIRKP